MNGATDSARASATVAQMQQDCGENVTIGQYDCRCDILTDRTKYPDADIAEQAHYCFFDSASGTLAETTSASSRGRLMDEIPSDLVREISEFHLITTELEPADLLFVFGTRLGVDEFVAEIGSLWSRGFFKHCIVSGGVTAGATESECSIIKLRMTQIGVPPDIILEEHRAMNTGENVLFSLPVIDRHLGLAKIESVIALGKICTSRRYLMTLQRYWPSVRKMLVAVNYFKTHRDQWHLDQAFRERVLREFSKIEPYKKAGFIADWP